MVRNVFVAITIRMKVCSETLPKAAANKSGMVVPRVNHYYRSDHH